MPTGSVTSHIPQPQHWNGAGNAHALQPAMALHGCAKGAWAGVGLQGASPQTLHFALHRARLLCSSRDSKFTSQPLGFAAATVARTKMGKYQSVALVQR